MILKKITDNTTPYDLCAMATKLPTNKAKLPKEEYERDFCYCNYECDTCDNLVFGGSTNPINNDKSSFFFKKQRLSDTYTLKLLKNGVQVALLNSNALGELFNFGLQIGFIVDWNLVYNAFGSGSYEIETDYSVLGITGTLNSHGYTLRQFTEECANGTVKIEWYQNGKIQSSDFDFTGLNWYNSVRLRANFKTNTPELVQENYLDSNRVTTQIQSSIIDNYLLTTKIICKDLKDTIYYDLVLANQMLITNFNLFEELIIQKEVNVKELGDLETFALNRNFVVNILFESRVKNILKRNC